MRRDSAFLVLLASAWVLAGASAASAQEALPPPTQARREGWAILGIFARDLQRVGVLIPLGDHWMLRPDFKGGAWDYEDIESGWYANPGLSLIARTAPAAEGWVYASARVAYQIEDYGYDAYSSWALTLTAGGHATLSPLLGVFGEAGAAYSYHEYGSEAIIDRSFEPVLRFGFAVRRPRPR